MEILKIKDWSLNLPTEGPIIIAGPCSVETETQTLASCHGAARAGAHLLRGGIWKPRTNPGSFEGLGEQGLKWLQKAKAETGLPITCEVANADHVRIALAHGVDVLWIGARTTVNPFAVQAIADALRWHDVPIMVKNPVNPDVKLWIGAVKRLQNVGLSKIAAIHRGFDTLAQKNLYRNPPNWNLVQQFREALPEISIINDPSHIAGRRDLLRSISQKAIDLGLDGLMIETHIDPDNAWSDAKQQVTPDSLQELLSGLQQQVQAESSTTSALESWRSEIDILDKSLMELLALRKDLVKEIAKCKQDHNIAIVQLERWRAMVRKRLEDSKQLGLNQQLVTGIFDAIHADSVQVQQSVSR